jgi:4-hydroxy-4-methyl-2-oxoglutarate aldolase
VNVPVVLGGQVVAPGDVVVGDDDGVVVVPRNATASALAAARERVEREQAAREAFRNGELGLDRYGLRDRLAALGVEYVSHADHAGGEAG